MPSAAPNRANDYQFAPAPAPAQLSRAVWSSVMADVAARLKILEDVDNGIAQIQAELQQFGLLRLDEAILPLIQQTQASIAVLQQKVTDTIAQNDALIEDFQEQIDTAIATLTASIVALQAQVDLILGGGIPAANVAESGSRVFVTPAQKAEIGQLRTDLTALSVALAGYLLKQVWSSKAVNFTAAAGNNYIVTGGVTVTFPTTTTDGDRIGIVTETDAETTAVNIALSGKAFDGATTNIVIKRAVSLMFEYRVSAWRLAP